MEPSLIPVITAQAKIETIAYKTVVTSAGHTLIADEPETSNGCDAGMSPYGLLLASLGSCTAITLRMYVTRKMWIVPEITVKLKLFNGPSGVTIKRELYFIGEIAAEQKNRMIQIANACPIHKMLTGNIKIETMLA